MGYSVAWGELIHEKNLKSKISWHCPFELPFKLEWEHFKLIYVRRKIMYLRKCGSFNSAKNNWFRKLQIRKSQKYMVYKSQIRKSATFAEGSQI
jgi:hypothetical protein